jgi:hypothetical protein
VLGYPQAQRAVCRRSGDIPVAYKGSPAVGCMLQTAQVREGFAGAAECPSSMEKQK